MFEKTIQIKDTNTNKKYKLSSKEHLGCTGCAFRDDNTLCYLAPGYCSKEDAIWEEIE